ncbi:MAG: hypothetical protein KJI71_05440 [Patescibacteria group bacterium]|nr:hypothetical protein [Patescibacteria group bacterium]
MNIGTLGFLGLLQTVSPQDTSLQDSVATLMDSIVPAVNSVETVTLMDLFHSQGSFETYLAGCKLLVRGDQQGSVKAGLCRKALEPGQNRPAAIISVNLHTPGVQRELVTIDWDVDYNADVCYENSRISAELVERRFLNPEDCQPLYHESLKKFEGYKKQNKSLG